MTAINHTFATLDERHQFDTIIDVRSPGEFADDHIPGAINCPVLNDEERIQVGTLYKQESPFVARKVGAALVARNIANHMEQTFSQQPKGWRPLVYCWRGGQRSGSMTHILREVGWPARRLQGGYKTWRHFVLEQLQLLPQGLEFRVVAGPTGSAKTRILEALQLQGHQVLNREALGAHKGSVLGVVPGQEQPSQKMFETLIHDVLRQCVPQRPVFVESESRRLGQLRLPPTVYQAIQDGQWLHVDADRVQRVQFLLTDYAYFLQGNDLVRHLERLTELCGREVVDRWKNLAQTQNFALLVDELLTLHYDRHYARSLQRVADSVEGRNRFTASDLSAPGIELLAQRIGAASAGQGAPAKG